MRYSFSPVVFFLSLLIAGQVTSAADTTRRDFVDAVIDESCESCSSATALTQWKYAQSGFIDLSTQKDALCSNMAEEHGFIEGYDQKTPCQNGNNPVGVKFCPSNAITKVEATAIILRATYLWNEELDKKSINPRIAPEGVDAKWAHYISKAQEYKLWGTIPGASSWDTPLTTSERAELLNKLTSLKPICPTSKNIKTGGLGVRIDAIRNGSSLSAQGVIEGPLSTQATMNWTLIRRSEKGDESTKLASKNLNIDPITLEPNIEYGLILEVTSSDGVKSTAFVNIPKTNTPPLNPLVNPLWDGLPLGLTASHNTPLTWQIKDIERTGVHLKETLTTPGIYPLSVTQDGLYYLSTIFATDSDDLDTDGVPNTKDKCPRVKANGGIDGCPRLTIFGNRGINASAQIRDHLTVNQNDLGANTVGGDRSGGLGGLGDIFGRKNGAVKSIYEDTSACERDAIANFGSLDLIAICNQCPCEQTIHSRLQVKACDRIYPAYLSNDKSTLYSQGAAGEVPFGFGF